MRNTLWIGFVFFSCTECRKCLIFSMSVICTYLYFGVRCYNLLNKAYLCNQQYRQGCIWNLK